jgi:hypothetical protein
MEDKVTVGAVICTFVLFFACGFFMGLFTKSIGTLEPMIGRQTTHGIVYKVSIDTSMTDSLYGKIWKTKEKK